MPRTHFGGVENSKEGLKVFNTLDNDQIRRMDPNLRDLMLHRQRVQAQKDLLSGVSRRARRIVREPARAVKRGLQGIVSAFRR